MPWFPCCIPADSVSVLRFGGPRTYGNGEVTTRLITFFALWSGLLVTGDAFEFSGRVMMHTEMTGGVRDKQSVVETDDSEDLQLHSQGYVGYTKALPNGGGMTMIPGPSPTSDCFLSDQRTFSNSPTVSSRTRSTVEIDATTMTLITQNLTATTPWKWIVRTAMRNATGRRFPAN
jgi:hypothetical protein